MEREPIDVEDSGWVRYVKLGDEFYEEGEPFFGKWRTLPIDKFPFPRKDDTALTMSERLDDLERQLEKLRSRHR